MQPDPTKLVKQIDIIIPLIGFYDAPEPAAFAPLVKPPRGKYKCIFDFYINWLNGETLDLTKENFGCGGCVAVRGENPLARGISQIPRRWRRPQGLA